MESMPLFDVIIPLEFVLESIPCIEFIIPWFMEEFIDVFIDELLFTVDGENGVPFTLTKREVEIGGYLPAGDQR